MNLQEILDRLNKVKKVTGGYQACCPSHKDDSPSLSITEGEQGIIMFCHAGCTFPQIASSMGLKESDFFYEKPKEVVITPIKRKIVEVFPYTDAFGKLLFETCRIEPGRDGKKKEFSQRHVVNGQIVWNMEGVERVLYNLPAVYKDEQVIIVEGERKANWINELGYTATCNVGGAGKWLDAWSDCLRGKHIVICPDNDEPGQDHARRLHKTLSGKVASIMHVKVPKPHNDIVDYFRAIGADMEQRKKAFIDLLMEGRKVPQNLDIPLKSMDQLEEEYIEFCKSSAKTTLHLGNWLPSFKNLRPLVPGEMLTILADTGVGKTMALHNLAINAAPLYVALFELELPGTLTFERLAAFSMECSGDDINSWYLSDKPQNWKKNEQVKRIFTCSESNLSVEKIREIIHKSELVMDERPAVVMIDYIQLMKGKGSRYEKTSDVAEALKVLAKEENVVLITASQVSREGCEEITLHSGKDSGSIENSSGAVLGMWREDKGDGMVVRLLKYTKGRSKDFNAIICDIDRSLRLVERMPFTGKNNHDDPI